VRPSTLTRMARTFLRVSRLPRQDPIAVASDADADGPAATLALALGDREPGAVVPVQAASSVAPRTIRSAPRCWPRGRSMVPRSIRGVAYQVSPLGWDQMAMRGPAESGMLSSLPHREHSR
jgi:hypothetical protein